MANENKIVQSVQILLTKHLNGGKKQTAFYDTVTGRAWVETFDSNTQTTSISKEFLPNKK